MHKPGSRFLVLLSCVTVVALIAGCGALPTPTPAPATLASELINLVKPTLPTPSATPGPGNMDVSVLQLNAASGSNLWAAYSTGFRPLQPERKHFVAIYSRDTRGWNQLSSADVECGDMISDKGVKQVQIDPSRIWLQVEGMLGAHSGCFNILSFDGVTLRSEASNMSSSADAGRVEDVNGDGKDDVILNQTDYYVFCYACQLRYYQYETLRWDGAKLAEVKLATLPDSVPANLRALTNQAVALAQAGLWKDAQETITQAQALASNDATVAWDAGLIKLHAADFARQAADGPYPLLDHVFYGDYAAALNDVRQYTPDQLFSAKSPLLTAQIAQGWDKSISNWITKTTTLAIGVKPALAAAYFLRGWAIAIAQPGSPVAVADIEKAAQLAPGEPFFASSLQYLRKK